MKQNDEQFIRAAIAAAQRSRKNGNFPFGAVLVDDKDNILIEAENTSITNNDCTGHAETNLMRIASSKYEREFLKKCTVYTSTEPCAMCCGAIYWGNIRRLVYGLSAKKAYELLGNDSEGMKLHLSSREVLSRGDYPIEVVGPLLEEEAIIAHQGFWK